MAQFKLLNANEIGDVFAAVSRRSVREEELRPYRDAVDQLSKEMPGGVIDIEEGEDPKTVMTRMHQAAHEKNKYLRFQRHGRNQRQLRFRLQTPEETARLKERGTQLAKARQAKR